MLMVQKVYCPGCNTCLQVPDNASGLRARCPSCQTSFNLPSTDELIEHTLASWIEEDVEQEAEVRSAHFQTALAPRINMPFNPDNESTKRHIDFAGPSRQTTTVAKHRKIADAHQSGMTLNECREDESKTANPSENEAAGDVAATAPGDDENPTPATTAPKSGDEPVSPSLAETTPGKKASRTPNDNSQPRPRIAPAVNPREAGATPASSEARHPLAQVRFELPSMLPPDLHVTGPIPHLVVTECNQGGVQLSFDSVWLEHMGFRCSMPVRGVFGNNADVTQLRSRPLAFIDRSGGTMRDPQEFEARYEQPLMPGWSARDLIANMGIIKGLPGPLNHPMPYYVDSHHTNLSLVCTTERRPDGGLTCRVNIPNGPYALDWLARVNGMCGAEYLQLQGELLLLGSDAWGKLSESCRARISVWTRFRPRERFLAFLSDADFGSHDAGLAGLVLTDQRIIYHKYHHSGDLELATPGKLRLRIANDFAQLTYQDKQGERHKLVRLHVSDIEPLGEHLAGLKSQIELIEG